MKNLSKRFWIGLGIGFSVAVLIAAVPVFQDFNTGQFDVTGNKVAIKSGAAITNAALENPKVKSATLSRIVFTNSLAPSGLKNWALELNSGGLLSIVVYDDSLVTPFTLMSFDGGGKVVTTNLNVGTSISPLGITSLGELTTNGVGGVWVNGTNVLNANLTNTASVSYAIVGSNVVATATGSGGGSDTNWVALGLSGTNVTGLVPGPGTNHFKLLLTGNAWFGIPTVTPTTNTPIEFTVVIAQNGNNLYTVGWTNAAFDFMNNVAPLQSTNNGAVDTYSFVSHPFTNGAFMGVQGMNFHH